MADTITFVKLGGSLITDKTRESTARPEVLRRLAAQVRGALDEQPALQLLLGHGSGSFGHVAARRFGTRAGVRTAEDWLGFARVGAAAARLNRIVADAFLEAGVPILNLQPSASAVCRDGVIQSLALEPIRTALEHGLVPLVYGDVATDLVRGGTIISTEEIMAFLARHLRPERILLAGEVDGVMDAAGRPVPLLRPGDLPRLSSALGGSRGVDVTGGMLSKVTAMLDLVAAQPGLTVQIFSGLAPAALRRTLLEPDYPAGTRLSAW